MEKASQAQQIVRLFVVLGASDKLIKEACSPSDDELIRAKAFCNGLFQAEEAHVLISRIRNSPRTSSKLAASRLSIIMNRKAETTLASSVIARAFNDPEPTGRMSRIGYLYSAGAGDADVAKIFGLRKKRYIDNLKSNTELSELRKAGIESFSASMLSIVLLYGDNRSALIRMGFDAAELQRAYKEARTRQILAKNPAFSRDMIGFRGQEAYIKSSD